MKQIKRQYIRRIGFSLVALSILVASLAFANWAQQPTALSSRSVYYDTFNEQWLNPTKWIPNGPGCERGFTMECVREIQNGRLRLAVRNIGATDSDLGSQFAESDVYFVNPNSINSTTADVTLSRFSGLACPANTDQPSRTIVKIQGNFFNTGSGDPVDDISDEVDMWVDPSNPKTMIVGNWFTGSGLGIGTPIGNYPLGTPLRLYNTWDKANHQFISVVQVIGESDPGKRVVVPYTVSDTTLPAYAEKQLTTFVYSQNCTSAQTFAQVEAFFDNVMINVGPKPAE
jgi:hypothetical protein